MKRELSRTKTVLWAMVLVVMLGSTLTKPAVAEEDSDTCSLSTLKGKYVFAATGFNMVNGVAVPKTVAEFLTMDGNGAVTFVATAVIGGNKISDNTVSTGSYTVNSDCTGTLTVGSFPFPVFNLYISPGGKEFVNIQVATSGQMLVGTVRRISR